MHTNGKFPLASGKLMSLGLSPTPTAILTIFLSCCKGWHLWITWNSESTIAVLYAAIHNRIYYGARHNIQMAIQQLIHYLLKKATVHSFEYLVSSFLVCSVFGCLYKQQKTPSLLGKRSCQCTGKNVMNLRSITFYWHVFCFKGSPSRAPQS